MKSEVTNTRPYRMTARAKAAQATGEAIVDAATAAFGSRPFEQVTLNEIAEAAGVTVQTVIRRFGSKEDLFDAVARREQERIVAERASQGAGNDLASAVRVLVDHYERDGDMVLHLLGQEHVSPKVRKVLDEGREIHRQWVEQHCRPVFAGTRGKERTRRINAAIVATDIGAWKLLRRDQGLEREEVEMTMLKLLTGLGEGS